MQTGVVNRPGVEPPAAPAARAERISWLVLLHLLPGAVGTTAYILLAGPMEAAHYPPLAALLLAIALVILPIEVLIMLGFDNHRNRKPV